MAAIILTNLVLLPVALSYVHFEADYSEKLHRRARRMERLWRRFAGVTKRTPAVVIVILTVMLGIVETETSSGNVQCANKAMDPNDGDGGVGKRWWWARCK